MSNPTPNNQQQMMLSLAYLSYIDELIPGLPPPDAQIEKDITAALAADSPITPVAGLWNIVWGPVTYTVPGSYYQDYMMYVANYTGNSAIAQYAVVVRGTNGKVVLDWFIGDMDVFMMMPWPYGSAASSAVGLISESTNIGITLLLAMQDTNAQSLFDFLTSAMSSSEVTQAGICFTGHSLGATLASTLGLHARDIQSSWDPQLKATVTTINFAGPTAGDANFAAYFNKSFSYQSNQLPYWTPPAGLSSYADCIRNSLDLAPMAWNYTTLNAAPRTYDLHLLIPKPGTSEVVSMIAGAVQSKNYTQTQVTQAVWEGAFVSESGQSDDWFAEVEYQHVDGYPTLLGVPELLNVFSSAVPRQAGTMITTP